MLPFFLLVGLACCSAATDPVELESVHKRVLVYHQGLWQAIPDKQVEKKIMLEVIRLFIEADDFTWKSIGESDLQQFRREGCVEVVFAVPRKIVLQAVKEKKTVSRILVPLGEAMCSRDAQIVFGDPDYKNFNLLLNSRGCAGLRNMVRQAVPGSTL